MNMKKTNKTFHMGVAVAFMQRLSDEQLTGVFKSGGKPIPARRARKYLKELLEAGYEVVPCHCGNYDETGRCKGAK